MADAKATVPRGVHAYAVVCAVATFVLVIAGGLVTSTGSALSVPDWPLSYGQVMPPMEGGVFYEHGHRLVAATVGLMTIVLTLLLWRHAPGTYLSRLGAAALGTVVLQGLLGGLTVLMELPAPVSIAHGCLGQIYFVLMAVLALVTSPGWSFGRRGRRSAMPSVLLGAVLVQLVLGAWMRHLNAGLAIPDFPLAFGRVVPPLGELPVAIHFAHRLWAVVVAVIAVTTAVGLLRHAEATGAARNGAGALLGLVTLQVLLGAAVVLTLRSVAVTTAHVATGALILATSTMLVLEGYRKREGLSHGEDRVLVLDRIAGGVSS